MHALSTWVHVGHHDATETLPERSRARMVVLAVVLAAVPSGILALTATFAAGAR